MFQGFNPSFGGMNPGINPGFVGMNPGINPGFVGMNPGINPGFVGMNSSINPGFVGMNPCFNQGLGMNPGFNPCFPMNQGFGINPMSVGNTSNNNSSQQSIITGDGPYNQVINVNFQQSTGNTLILKVANNVTIAKLCLEYANRVNISESTMKSALKFIYNAAQLDPESKELVGNKLSNNTNIIVYDQKNIIGAI